MLRDWFVQFTPAHLPVIVRWLATGYLLHSLIDEVNESSGRVSEIVMAVKNYTYLDQAPVQEISVTEGLDNTLLILKHKLKQGVQVVRDYDPALPLIEAFASELNQVWTNIIDNAIDAMEGKGALVITTRHRDGTVTVDIANNGPAIPDAVRARMFEPFYSTKGSGGTGLGLHISHNIVQKHRGRIEVNSDASLTHFIVSLPVHLTGQDRR